MEENGSLPARQSTVINRRLPVLAVSAQIDLVGERILAQQGFDGFLEKPVNFDRLRCILAGVMLPELRQDLYWRYDIGRRTVGASLWLCNATDFPLGPAVQSSVPAHSWRFLVSCAPDRKYDWKRSR